MPRRPLRLEAAEIARLQIGDDVAETAGGEEGPDAIEVIRVKLLTLAFRPGDIMAAVVRVEIQTILLVRGDDDAADIKDRILAQMLLIDAQDVRRRVGVFL